MEVQRSAISRRQIVEYDALSRRLWILGQRCHHGATGSCFTALGFLGFAASRQRSLLALVATGSALMAHDWKDHSVWFQRGRGVYDEVAP